MPILKFSQKILCSLLCLFVFGLFSYAQIEKDYHKLIDSADANIDESSEKALIFLESIPKPIENYIPGRVAEYYSLRALIYDEHNEYTKYHQSCVLAIKYAEKEDDFCVAGEACIGLFSNLYLIDKDSTAFNYLNKAREYYKKCDYEFGIIDVEQVEAYAMFLDSEYKKCNQLLLNKLDKYKNIKEDKYYYMFALYMVISNYIYLDDFDNAYKYFKAFKSLENDPSIVKYNFYSFKAGLNACFADVYFEQKQIDSTQAYLNSSSPLISYMSEDVLKEYYELNADLNNYIGNIEKSKNYIDSLLQFQSEMHEKTIEASFEVTDSLAKAESEISEQKEKESFNNFLTGFLVLVLLILSLGSFIYYRRKKDKLDYYNQNAKTNLTYLKSNNEQLAIKVYGLEEYIKNLKIEVRQISRTDSIENQKEKIKDLYKNLHINSSTLLDKSENHLELVNDLNIEFFKKIKENHVQLNKSEIIICYYLFMGFTNKEIAVFLNATIRSVESRRYRISKKINLSEKGVTLIEYLQKNYSDTLRNNLI